ncbi:MAG: MBL fold metallo-hydrolase [Chloroflexota bacterium]
MFAELADGIWAVESRFVAGKAGIVLGERLALAVDACNYADEGLAMADWIAAHGHAPDHLALTHGHGDHILGGAPFRGATVYAHTLTPETVARQVPRLAERLGLTPDEARARLPWPTVTFDRALRLDLGGRHVRLFHTPGHSADGICVYVEEERILFGGDTVVTGIVPAIGDGDSRALVASLLEIASLEIATLVPGHGPVVRGPGEAHAWIEVWIAYLRAVREAAWAGLARGQSADGVIAGITYEVYVGARLSDEPFGMRQRHRNTVAKIVDEECQRLGCLPTKDTKDTRAR